MPPQSILITGASSGLGAGLARHYAREGTHLFLCGRDEERLNTVAQECRTAGATVETAVVNVDDAVAMRGWITTCDQTRPLDLVIANAGISAGTGHGGETEEQCRAIFATNQNGVLNTVWPAIDVLRPRRQGQIAIMASLAGFRGFAGAPSYCATKAAVRVWGEALRDWLAPKGVKVNVICPGFVTTPLVAHNRFPMPFLMDCPKAVAIIARGLERNQGRIAFPFPTRALVWLMAALPDAFIHWLARKMGKIPGKGSV